MEMTCHTKDREEKGEEQAESSPEDSLGMVLADDMTILAQLLSPQGMEED